MNILIAGKIALFSIAVTVFGNCNSSYSNVHTKGHSKEKESPFEGYINFTVQVFDDIDERGQPKNHPNSDNSQFFSPPRRMYLYGNLLIDVSLNSRFEDGKYMGTDTTGFNFHDLSRQRFIKFDRLSVNASALERGLMGKGGSFSKAADFDPMNDVSDSLLKFTDTIIDHRSVILAFFETKDSEYQDYARRAKFWIDTQLKGFPLQLSYLLSAKKSNAFVYKMQLPMPDGKAVMITEFNYQPAKLNDTLSAVFEEWNKRVSAF